MKKHTFKSAAIHILKNADEPMTAKEITSAALSQELIETAGATPEATMAAYLYGDTGKFKKIGVGHFVLINQAELSNSPLVTVQKQNSVVRQKLIERIRRMDPFEFEFLIAELLRKIGYEEVDVTKKTGDKGIDVIGNLTVDGITHVKTVIQVKRYQKGSNISGKYITQLRGSAEVDQRGLIITTSDFTKDAIRESKAKNKMPVALVNGEKLIDLLFKYKLGVKEDIISVYSVDHDLFDSELSDNSVKDLNSKSKSIWPLPGGVNSYVETLIALLQNIKSNKSSREEIVQWFLKTYDNVTSKKTALGYLNVPKNMGLIEVSNKTCRLTEQGEIFLQSKDIDFLHDTISTNIIAFDDIYQLLKNSSKPKTDMELLDFVNENYDVEWRTLAQINFRLRWLTNLKKVERRNEGYVAI